MASNSDLDKKWEKSLRALGYAILQIEKENSAEGPDRIRLTDLRFKLDADNRTSVLCILKGVRQDTLFVAFVGGFDLQTTVLSVAEKLRGDNLRWRVDEPWHP